MLNEDFKGDASRRDLASKMAKTIITSIPKHKNDVLMHPEYFIISITQEMHKLDKHFADYDFAVLFSDKNKDGSYACSQATVSTGRECIFFKLPYLTASPQDTFDYLIFNKNRKKMVNVFQDFLASGDRKAEAIETLKREGLKYVGAYLIKELKKEIGESETYNILVHECIHALDKMRYSPSYNPKEQDTSSEEGLNNYFNRTDEQNAYLQQTLYIIDEWVREKYFERGDFKSFDKFFDMFVSQYRGSYKRLTPNNKKKIQKKLYDYYKHIFATPKYEDFTNPKY